jgi:hypothetical protein
VSGAEPGRADAFPLGARATVEELEDSPYALLAALREREPVSWLPALDGWLVTRRDLALEVMQDATTYTVQDPRFTTARVVGESMLSLDGPEHARHRAPFAPPLRRDAVHAELTPGVREEAARLVAGLAPAGEAELRRAFAGPLAAAVVTRLLGLDGAAVDAVLGWYDAIVAAVTDLTAGRPAGPQAAEAVQALGAAVRPSLDTAAAGDLTPGEVTSNVAVMLFGGIETTEGMIVSAAAHLLADPAELARAREDPGRLLAVVEESLRLEPAAAVVDRYATADALLGGARIAAGDLVRVSLTAANRDPAAFPEPDRFLPGRPNARRQLAFAGGPHVCIGMHLARVEAHAALEELLTLPGLRLADPGAPPAARGLVFRKPAEVRVRWDPAG